MKIHVGSGNKYLEGWFNVDIDVRLHADAHSPADDLNMVADGSADVVMAIHLFEHLYPWEVDKALTEWRRVLKPGGELILEMPDIIKAAKNLLAGTTDNMSMWAIYGDPHSENPFYTHKWGWHPLSIKLKLDQHEFKNFREERPQFHGRGRKHRDMRVVATKG
jgi:ubiquinone/menaquinone biosynthesis C-methylase UbiE